MCVFAYECERKIEIVFFLKRERERLNDLKVESSRYKQRERKRRRGRFQSGMKG